MSDSEGEIQRDGFLLIKTGKSSWQKRWVSLKKGEISTWKHPGDKKPASTQTINDQTEAEKVLDETKTELKERFRLTLKDKKNVLELSGSTWHDIENWCDFLTKQGLKVKSTEVKEEIKDEKKDGKENKESTKPVIPAPGRAGVVPRVTAPTIPNDKKFAEGFLRHQVKKKWQESYFLLTKESLAYGKNLREIKENKQEGTIPISLELVYEEEKEEKGETEGKSFVFSVAKKKDDTKLYLEAYSRQELQFWFDVLKEARESHETAKNKMHDKLKGLGMFGGGPPPGGFGAPGFGSPLKKKDDASSPSTSPSSSPALSAAPTPIKDRIPMGGIPMGMPGMFGSPLKKPATPSTPDPASSSAMDEEVPTNIPELPKTEAVDGQMVHLTRAKVANRGKTPGKSATGRRLPTKRKVDFASLTETPDHKKAAKVTLTSDPSLASPAKDSVKESPKPVSAVKEGWIHITHEEKEEKVYAVLSEHRKFIWFEAEDWTGATSKGEITLTHKHGASIVETTENEKTHHHLHLHNHEKKSVLKARFSDKEEGHSWLKHIEKHLQELQTRESASPAASPQKGGTGTPRESASPAASPQRDPAGLKVPSSIPNSPSTGAVSTEKRSSNSAASLRKEGWLGKAGRINRSIKDRYIVLTDHHVAYYDIKDKSNKPNWQQSKAGGTLEISAQSEVKVEESGSGKNAKYLIKLKIKPGGRELILSAHNKAEMTDWWTAIDLIIQNKCKKQEISLPTSPSSLPTSPSNLNTQPTHGCLREGFLKKPGGRLKPEKETYAVLTDKQLAHYELNSSNCSTWNKANPLGTSGILANSQVTIEESGSGAKAKYLIKLVSKPGDKPFILSAHNKTEMLDWWQAIDQAIKDKKGGPKKAEEKQDSKESPKVLPRATAAVTNTEVKSTKEPDSSVDKPKETDKPKDIEEKGKENVENKAKTEEETKEKPKDEETKEKPKDEETKEKPKDEENKEKPKDEENKEKPKEDEETKEKPKEDEENKEKPKDEENKEKPKDEENKEKPKEDEENKEKPKDEENKEKPKDDEENKEKPKDENKEKPRDEENKEKPKDDENKEKPKDEENQEKPKPEEGENKEKPKEENKEKPKDDEENTEKPKTDVEENKEKPKTDEEENKEKPKTDEENQTKVEENPDKTKTEEENKDKPVATETEKPKEDTEKEQVKSSESTENQSLKDEEKEKVKEAEPTEPEKVKEDTKEPVKDSDPVKENEANKEQVKEESETTNEQVKEATEATKEQVKEESEVNKEPVKEVEVTKEAEREITKEQEVVDDDTDKKKEEEKDKVKEEKTKTEEKTDVVKETEKETTTEPLKNEPEKEKEQEAEKEKAQEQTKSSSQTEENKVNSSETSSEEPRNETQTVQSEPEKEKEKDVENTKSDDSDALKGS